MYNSPSQYNPLFPYNAAPGHNYSEFQKPTQPRSGYSTAAQSGIGGSTPTKSSPMISEEDVAAAREVLRSVIASSGSRQLTPRGGARRLTTDPTEVSACLPPLPVQIQKRTVATQTSVPDDKVPIEGLVRAAGMSLMNFAEELKTLERQLDNRSTEILREIKKIQK